jgi:nucleotide-binding universal stress UspA family protein
MKEGAMTQVLIATDGSELARHAAVCALGLFRSGADVTIVTAVSPPVAVLPAPDDIVGMAQPIGAEMTETLVRDGEAMVHAVARRLGLGEARTRVLIGQPGPELCRLAAEEAADVVVVGSHGRGVLKRVLLGSVSDYLVHHSPCPVLVVRGPGDGQEASG